MLEKMEAKVPDFAFACPTKYVIVAIRQNELAVVGHIQKTEGKMAGQSDPSFVLDILDHRHRKVHSRMEDTTGRGKIVGEDSLAVRPSR